MKIEPYRSVNESELVAVLTVSDSDQAWLGRAIYERVVTICAEHIAAVFLEQHQTDVLAQLDPQAIANLAVAASGGAIRDMLGKKLPDVTHIVKAPAEVYQRGIFGGLRKIG